VAGTLMNEDGWRDFSPSTVRRFFGDLAWRGATSAINVSLTAASNDLTGNGAAPPVLLSQDRAAVFTYPDETANDSVLLTLNARRQLSSRVLLEGVAYLRRSAIDTFNGDAADDDDDDDEEESGDEEDGAHFDAVNNTSGTRGRSGGATAQLTWTTPLAGRENHFIAGGGIHAASTRFDSATELATLAPKSGTIGRG